MRAVVGGDNNLFVCVIFVNDSIFPLVSDFGIIPQTLSTMLRTVKSFFELEDFVGWFLIIDPIAIFSSFLGWAKVKTYM